MPQPQRTCGARCGPAWESVLSPCGWRLSLGRQCATSSRRGSHTVGYMTEASRSWPWSSTTSQTRQPSVGWK